MLIFIIDALVGAALEELGTKTGKAVFRGLRRLARRMLPKQRARRAPVRRRSTRKGGRP
jgi:hypothetical protein